MLDFSALAGKIFTDVRATAEAILFTVSEEERYSLHHEQDCCEDVGIEDVNGDLMDLVGTPIVLAEERYEDNPEASESGTWSFYALRTHKGNVDIRFYGESNGYYSETASLYRI